MYSCVLSPGEFNPNIFIPFTKKYLPKDIIYPHSHDYTTLIYIISGKCRYKLDEYEYDVSEGDLIVCSPWIFHGKTVDKGEEVCELHCAFENISIKNLPKEFIISQETCPVIKFDYYLKEFTNCIDEILEQLERRGAFYELAVKTLVMRLIVIILKATYKSEEFEPQNQEYEDSIYNTVSDKANIVKEIIEYIDKNYMKDISLNKISQNMYLSSAYLANIFKEETGGSLINYLIKVRLGHARDMIQNENVSIKTAAKNVGYGDAYYFSKLYKKYFGTSPSLIKGKHV